MRTDSQKQTWLVKNLLDWLVKLGKMMLMMEGSVKQSGEDMSQGENVVFLKRGK